MKQFIILTIALVLTAFQGKAIDYKDYIITDKYIWGLTTSGTIILFDVSTGKKADEEVSNDTKIIILTKDKDGVPVIADESRQIKKYNLKNNSWTTISEYEDDIFGIVFDKKGTCYAITGKGIVDLSTKQKYFIECSLNHQIHFIGCWTNPTCHFIDKRDNIWIGFGFGEWGGDFLIFSATEKKFITPTLDLFRITLWPIKSFFEDSSNVYLSSGLMHFMTNGIILKFDNFKANVLFHSESHWLNLTLKDSTIVGEYIGPATYNPINNSIYFYSQNGIFRGDKSKDLSKFDNWERILQPRLKWKNGQPDAVGSPMNVFKLTCIEKNKFVFLSESDGIGFFDGEQLVMLN